MDDQKGDFLDWSNYKERIDEIDNDNFRKSVRRENQKRKNFYNELESNSSI